MRTGFGVGTLVAILLSVVLFLFGLVTPLQTVAVFLLLVGLWSVAFGLALAGSGDKLYYAGWGIAVALGSTFTVIPVQYTVALVLLAVIAVVVFSSVRINRKAPNAQAQ